MIVQEVYIGRVPEIEDIFTEFKELRHTYAAWKTGNTSKRTAKIEKMIEDFWGFKAFSLDIDPSSSPNAFTYPVATSIDIDPSKYIKTTSKGYFYTKEANVAALSIITKGLFCNKAFSDEEAFAVFLHEIGHSFVHRSPMIISQQEVYKTSMIIQIVQNIILGILMANPFIISDAISAGLSSSNFYKLFMTRINKAIKKIPVLREVNMSLSYLSSLFMNTVGNIFYTVTTLTGLNYLLTKYSKYVYDSVGKQQIEISGRANAYQRSLERLSDDFASMYGFGPQLSTALVKMENPDNQGLFMKVTHSFPIIEAIFNKTDALAIELNGCVEAHPSTSDRILSILDGMESDLKKDKTMPDKVKKEIKANIQAQRKVIRDIKNNEGPIAKNRNNYLQALTILGIKNGNTEDFMEKRYTDRDALEKFYKERKVRKEAAIKEQAEMDLYLMGLDPYIESFEGESILEFAKKNKQPKNTNFGDFALLMSMKYIYIDHFKYKNDQLLWNREVLLPAMVKKAKTLDDIKFLEKDRLEAIKTLEEQYKNAKSIENNDSAASNFDKRTQNMVKSGKLSSEQIKKQLDFVKTTYKKALFEREKEIKQQMSIKEQAEMELDLLELDEFF